MIGQKSALIHHGGGKPAGYSARGGTVSTDELVKATAADTTASYLDSKLSVNARLNKSVLNPGANEQIEIAGGDHFTLCWVRPQQNIVAPAQLYPPEMYSYAWPSGMGYYSDSGFKIKKICMLINNFNSTGNDTIYFRFREYIANGSKTTGYSTGDGNLVGTVFYDVPNTGGAQRYYFGGYDNVDWTVQGHYSLFAYILSHDIDDLDGVLLWAHCYKYPLT